MEAWGGWAIGLDGELAEKVISADVAGVVLEDAADLGARRTMTLHAPNGFMIEVFEPVK